MAMPRGAHITTPPPLPLPLPLPRAQAEVIITAATDAVVVVACDMPRLSAPTVRLLIECLERSPSAEAVVASTDRIQPLCAVWRPSGCSTLLSALERGERRLHAVLAELVTVAVVVNLQDLTNVNTPDDLPTRL